METVEQVLEEAKDYLRRKLEFTPSAFQIRDLREHCERALKLKTKDIEDSLRGKRINLKHSIATPYAEATVRFLYFEYGIILDFRGLAEEGAYQLRLMAYLKQKQDETHHL